jgi:hypothetical protein
VPKRSNEFQKLVYLVKQHTAGNAQVTESKGLIDRLTGAEREVDVCVEASIAGHSVTISLECQDHARPADVTWVEQMKAKHERLPTNVLILVSRSGFTEEAQTVAQRYGIEALRLENVTDGSIQALFGDTGSLWAKFFTLSPVKVVITVAASKNLATENVVVVPNNTLFTEDGQEVGSTKELVEFMVKLEYVGKELGRQGLPSHKFFEIRWDMPQRRDGIRLCLQKLDPPVLRPVDSIQVHGICEFKVAEFPLQRGLLGPVPVAWGVASLGDSPAIIVASKSETGEERVTLHLGDIHLDDVSRSRPTNGRT